VRVHDLKHTCGRRLRAAGVSRSASRASRASRAPRTADSRTSSTNATTSASEAGRTHVCLRSCPPFHDPSRGYGCVGRPWMSSMHRRSRSPPPSYHVRDADGRLMLYLRFRPPIGISAFSDSSRLALTGTSRASW
jgi:hypothetical protein